MQKGQNKRKKRGQKKCKKDKKKRGQKKTYIYCICIWSIKVEMTVVLESPVIGGDE